MGRGVKTVNNHWIGLVDSPELPPVAHKLNMLSRPIKLPAQTGPDVFIESKVMCIPISFRAMFQCSLVSA